MTARNKPIADKEREFVQNGGEFITHVPQVMRFS